MPAFKQQPALCTTLSKLKSDSRNEIYIKVDEKQE